MSNLYQYEQLSVRDNEILTNEIKENPKQVNSHIESFRRWVLSMPHLKCPTDAKFLLMFLRTAKFDHSVAQRRLDNFCTVRTSPKGSPLFFNFTALNDDLIEKVFRAHQNVPLGKNTAGELVILYKTKDWNSANVSLEIMLQVIYMSFDLILAKESTQINGIVCFFDLEGCDRKSLETWSDPQLLKTINRIWQDAFPIRMKGIIFYKAPTIFQVVLKIMKFFISEKHKQRIFQIENMDNLFNKIPGLSEIMPIEYGGKDGKLKDKVENWIKTVKCFYTKGNLWWSIFVDEEKRLPESRNYLKTYDDYKGETLSGTQGSFVKYDNVF